MWIIVIIKQLHKVDTENLGCPLRTAYSSISNVEDKRET